jgi:phenylalanyl-tRNA synthetase beta chain
MNYVMLEVGQPMHAFDAGLLAGGINARLAEKGEEIKTIDGQEIYLGVSDLVIADDKGPLAIAGVKGGKRAEINPYTKKIIVEAANFDPVSIYKTARATSLFTDASSRFSHGLSPLLAEVATRRAAELLKEICKAKVGELVDINFTKQPKVVLKFDVREFNKLTGLEMGEKEALGRLKSLGFRVDGRKVEVSPFRTDISNHADLAEEIVNLLGYDNLPEVAPRVPLLPAKAEDGVVLKDEIREILRGFGFSEVYNYSFVSRKDLTEYADPKWWGAVTLRNPISSDFQYLRPDLFIGLNKNTKDNLRYYDEVRAFEIGKIFTEARDKLEERLYLGMTVGFKKSSGAPLLELKGLANQLLREIGLTDYFFREEDQEIKYFEDGQSLRVEDGNHRVLGRVGAVKDGPNLAFAKINWDVLLQSEIEEKEHEPLSK